MLSSRLFSTISSRSSGGMALINARRRVVFPARTGYGVTSITGIPLAFLLVGVVLAVFAVGYVAMARRVANAGAFYTYVTHGLGRPAGVGAAWVALAAYNALQVGLYGMVGASAAPLLAQWFGVELPWWVVALAAWAVVAVLGVLHVDVNSRVLAVLLVAEIAVIVVFDVADLTHSAGGHISLDALSPTNLSGPAVGALLVLAVLGFVGFENSVVFAEESRDRHRTVPVATYTSLAVIAGLYAVSSWAMTVATGPDRIVAESAAKGPELVFALAAAQMGPVMAEVGLTLFATSLLAAMISFHNTTARYGFALGRERVLPAVFGRTSRSGAPKVASLAQSTVGLAVIVGYAYSGWDPVTRLFFWGGTSGGLGVLLLIAVTSVAIVVFFARRPSGEPRWRRVVAPVVAMVCMAVVAYLAVANFAAVLGPAPAVLPVAVPTIYLAAAVAGAGWALLLKLTRPQVYATIGLGARATASTDALGATLPGGWAAAHAAPSEGTRW
jgi:amino acid transporter